MTLGELFCVIGIVMHMELVKFSAKEEYWTLYARANVDDGHDNERQVG